MRTERPGAIPGHRSGEVFIIRRTRAQRLAGAAGWFVFATPLLIVLPFLEPTARAIVVTAVFGAGVLVAGFDLVARRDVRVELGVDGLRTNGRLVPWWAVDEVHERRFFGVRSVEITAFDLKIWLPAPRSGPIVPNPGFDLELALLRQALASGHESDPLRSVIVGLRTDADPTVIDLTEQDERGDAAPASVRSAGSIDLRPTRTEAPAP